MTWGKSLRDLRARAGRYVGGLPGQMLVLSIAVVIAADALLLGPSLGNFHDDWLRRRVDAAQIAALAVEAAPRDQVADRLERELLDNAGVKVVALHRAEGRVLTLESTLPAGALIRTVDLRSPRRLAAIADGASMLWAPQPRFVRALASPRFESGNFIEIVLSEQALKRDLVRHARRAFLESLVVSLLVGAILYAALLLLVVRRIRRLTTAIEAFGKRPQDASIAMAPSHGDDELSRTEVALARMGEDVRGALRQRERLAGLGAAVAKIAHDLRNSLATAQLVSERLSGSDDPKVRQSAPRLERAIARAANLAEAALKFGKADEPRPQLQSVNVHAALEEAAGDALAGHPHIVWVNSADVAACVRADADNLHRILVNLLRNAAAVLRDDPAARIEGAVTPAAGGYDIDVIDTGPGVAPDIRAALFQPFAAAQRDSGVGLGLAIARELARAQGGDVTLASSDAGGSCFRVTLPAS